MKGFKTGAVCLCFLPAMVWPAKAQVTSDVRVTFFHPKQLTRGQTTRVAIDGEIETVSVEVTPPEGVSVGKIEPPANPKEPGTKRWYIEFVVAKDAAPGERTVILVTSTGRSRPLKVVLPEHAPILSAFKAITIEKDPVKLVFDVTLYDAKDDVEDLLFTTSLKCGGELHIGYAIVDDVKKMQPGKYLLRTTMDAKASALPGICEFSLSITDKAKNEGRLTVPVEFK